ncbi:DUF4386 domain-containing protein [Cryobacterium mannosilyticum]|uniref:DUF4386 domain-containing protein n=1 Tax=Cryobacterium mannosilyticum TaxID=1259190 RepID=UPI0021023473|nr:DUF4386 domain-containing protein [Cryobacterium mannosilyticum]
MRRRGRPWSRNNDRGPSATSPSRWQLRRTGDPVLKVATSIGAASVLLSLIGFLRWVFVVPALAESYVAGDATARAAVSAAWMAQHQFGGALLGEHLGQVLAVAWSVVVSVIILRTRVLPRWLGALGLAAGVLYLLSQGEVLATAVPGFPIWEPAGILGSSGWGLWVAALGVTLLVRPVAYRRPGRAAESAQAPATAASALSGAAGTVSRDRE